MTENESIETLKLNRPFAYSELQKAIDMAIQSIEEIQQYRAIGTVDELKTAMKYVSLAKRHGTVGKAIDSCAEYESIGTIDEFKSLKEKNEPKKVEYAPTDDTCLYSEYVCPNCYIMLPNFKQEYCQCGQKLDWGE